jgi:general stress protein YciG
MGTKDRGFASMDRDRQREIAGKGGRAAHAKGTAHQWTPEEARLAGRKGGQVSRGGKGKAATETAAPETATAASDTDHAHDVSRFHDEGNPNG